MQRDKLPLLVTFLGLKLV